jgi:hypothetical protein
MAVTENNGSILFFRLFASLAFCASNIFSHKL